MSLGEEIKEMCSSDRNQDECIPAWCLLLFFLRLMRFSAVSLAGDLISFVNFETVVVSLASYSSEESTMDNPELQNILKCIIPRPFTRSFFSTGLQHADDLVKHGALRIILESLKSLAGLMLAIDSMAKKMAGKQGDTSRESIAYLHNLPGVNCFVELDKCLAVGGICCPATDALGTLKWVSLKQLIQDEVRAMLPEPQVLLKLLSLSGQKHKDSGMGLKRHAHLPEVGLKKLKLNDTIEDIDIILSGINTELNNGTPEDGNKLNAKNVMRDLDVAKDDRTIIAEIWGLSEQTLIRDEPNNAENFFQSKLLDAFKFYLIEQKLDEAIKRLEKQLVEDQDSLLEAKKGVGCFSFHTN